MTRLEVFEDMRAAREAAKATQDGTLYLTMLRHVSPEGVETYYGSANTLDEAYRYAGMEFQSIKYHCEIPSECRNYLESRKRQPAR